MIDEQLPEGISRGEPLDGRAVRNQHDAVVDIATGADVPGSEAAARAFYGTDEEVLVPNLQDVVEPDVDDTDSVDAEATETEEDTEEPDFDDYAEDGDLDNLYDDDYDDDDDEEEDDGEIPPLTAEQLEEDEQRRLADLRPKTFADRVDDIGRGPSHGKRRAIQRVARLMSQGEVAEREARARTPLGRSEVTAKLEARMDSAEWQGFIRAGEVTEEQALEHGLSQADYDTASKAAQPRSPAEKVIQDLERKYVDPVSQCWTGTDADLVRLVDLKKANATARLARHPFFREP